MDTKDTRVQNLLFLLSAAPIALGCVVTSDDTDTDAATTSPTTSPTTGETDPTGATNPTTDAMTTSQTSGTTEGPSDTTEAPADTTEGPADTTTGGVEIPEVCVGYGEQVGVCYMDKESGIAAAEYCVELIQGYYDAYGAECVTAFEEFLACLSALTCEEFTGADPVCDAESMALDTACAAQ